MGNKIQRIYVGQDLVRPNQQRSLSKNNNSEEIKKSELEITELELNKDSTENKNMTGDVAELKK